MGGNSMKKIMLKHTKLHPPKEKKIRAISFVPFGKGTTNSKGG